VTPAALLALDRFALWRGRIKGRLIRQH